MLLWKWTYYVFIVCEGYTNELGFDNAVRICMSFVSWILLNASQKIVSDKKAIRESTVW
jgi:hypothetical protein